ncbi:hypothetical protein PAXRUDRAFT_825215 [Paxillus rubicundulus Ve08.2h10]|uniref:Uncharacterized protein n=1 Tax=Paxillus rubicundulus Ve08.2h10 TaxID=930991 RepID=A0A0D0E0V5_9AGAM|nr:hypothetical protein PAXRUDRAFT_825215 [Paxillus rubicundulus Ve08.2h10]
MGNTLPPTNGTAAIAFEVSTWRCIQRELRSVDMNGCQSEGRTTYTAGKSCDPVWLAWIYRTP